LTQPASSPTAQGRPKKKTKAPVRRTKRGRPPKEEGEQRAKRILDAADSLFCERGFEGVSARDIADAAAVNKALVFYYYGSKDALFERVLTGYYKRHEEALQGAFTSEEGTFRERIHRVMDTYLDFIAKNRGYPRLVQTEIARQGPHLGTIQESMTGMLRWTERSMQGLPKTGPLAARHFFMSLSAITINWFTYSPVLGKAFGKNPLGRAGLKERREHLHWVIDSWLDRLEPLLEG
jgi:AcrR family transcriptional regulator